MTWSEPNGSTQEAMVQRLVHLGFEVRVELVRDDGETLSAQLTREKVEALELQHEDVLQKLQRDFLCLRDALALHGPVAAE